MQNTELQLFDPKELNTTAIKEYSIKGDRSVSPLHNPKKSLEENLNSIFPNHQEETKIQKSRRILGEAVTEMTDEQLGIFLTEVQYLLDTWLDSFERDIFDGLTLKQVFRGE